MKRKLLFIIATIISTGLFSQIRSDISVYQADSLINANCTNSCFKILDVRTPTEFAGGHLQNAVNIDYNSATFSQQIRQLNKNDIYLVHCQGGSRSAKAMDTLQVLAFQETYNLIGGYLAWKSAGFQVVTDTPNFNNSIVKVDISPNPASNFITIGLDADYKSTVHASIYNILGKLEKDIPVVQPNQKTDIRDLRAGIYFLIINVGDKKFKTKLIVRK